MATLPEEMLQMICWELAPGASRSSDESRVWRCKALYNLMRSSKAFQRVAGPVLYHTLIVGREPGQISLSRLLEICLTDPGMSNLIKRIDFGSFDAFHELPENGMRLKLPERLNYEKAMGYMKSVGVSSLSTRHDCLELISQDTSIAVILLLCKRLTDIKLYTYNWDAVRTLKLLDEAASTLSLQRASSLSTTGLKPLQFLRKVDTSDPDFDFTFRHPIGSFLPFLRLPVTETFTGCGLSLNTWEHHVPRRARYSLRNIHLYHCVTEAAGLEWLLTVCPGLVQLDLESADPFPRDEGLDLNDIGHVLRHYGTRLEHLTLHTADPLDSICYGMLGDLTSMSRLKTLHLEAEAIYGDHDDVAYCPPEMLAREYLLGILPPSLEALSIRTTIHMPDLEGVLDLQLLEMMTNDRFSRLHILEGQRARRFTLDPPPGWRDLSRGEELWTDEYSNDRFTDADTSADSEPSTVSESDANSEWSFESEPDGIHLCLKKDRESKN